MTGEEMERAIAFVLQQQARTVDWHGTPLGCAERPAYTLLADLPGQLGVVSEAMVR